MRTAIEFEQLFQKELKVWSVKLEKTVKQCKQRHSFLNPNHLEEIILSRIKKRKYLLSGINDENHPSQSYVRYNSYLRNVYALAFHSKEKYAVNPIGNFFALEFPALKRKHLHQFKTQPKKYAYKTNAFDWSIDELIKSFALYFLFETKIQGDFIPEASSITIGDRINKSQGYVSTKQVAIHFGKSNGTISRWAKNGDIPCEMKNGRYLFKLEEVKEWIKLK